MEHAAPNQLKGLLQAELESLQQLAALLDEEHSALVSGDAEALERITQRKAARVQMHHDCQTRRRGLIEAHQAPLHSSDGSGDFFSKDSSKDSGNDRSAPKLLAQVGDSLPHVPTVEKDDDGRFAASLEWLAASERNKALLQSCWKELLGLSDRCQWLHRRNGALIARLESHTRASLAILRGEDLRHLYTHQGDCEQIGGGRSLGEA